MRCDAGRVTGALCVTGNAGGVFHLCDGVVVAVESPGSPVAVVQDGAFAVAVGEVERCFVDESVDRAPRTADEGVASDLLLSETARRLDVLASLPFPLAPYRDRVVAAPGTEAAALTARQREIVAHATGRRTARDLAFVVGRSLYSVTVEISRMLGGGLLEIATPATSFGFSHWGLTSLRPRKAATQASGRFLDQSTSLPIRRRGEPGRHSGIV
ncbi:hypothetical protein [Umezawaea tangerina]|uniref:Uncharacterized protein n=1 Tax=Umezawaea tangerina TaxID=84725 RepID=A0A2T0TCW0_9PSEU|nr:hypothetical protein [Umezawaea tangerina]PRY43491.1 hypothetical protein CLV43_103234 [Umezawaea tangerina]